MFLVSIERLPQRLELRLIDDLCLLFKRFQKATCDYNEADHCYHWNDLGNQLEKCDHYDRKKITKRAIRIITNQF